MYREKGANDEKRLVYGKPHNRRSSSKREHKKQPQDRDQKSSVYRKDKKWQQSR
jgi:hypothetical protein